MDDTVKWIVIAVIVIAVLLASAALTMKAKKRT